MSYIDFLEKSQHVDNAIAVLCHSCKAVDVVMPSMWQSRPNYVRRHHKKYRHCKGSDYDIELKRVPLAQYTAI